MFGIFVFGAVVLEHRSLAKLALRMHLMLLLLSDLMKLLSLPHYVKLLGDGCIKRCSSARLASVKQIINYIKLLLLAIAS